MTHDDDPFDPKHDPYADVIRPASRPVSRRAWLTLAGAAPIACAAACAAPRRLVCAPAPLDDEHCTARFCRYRRA
ncbi:MAG: hypothetical protein JNL38_06270 [Myxococcales bacterium]|jgi:hypothetical protein|nr:hypothetical protein [Myxococcales bacterium]